VGRGARLGFEKFKSKKPNSGSGGGAKLFRPTNKEAPSATNGLSEPPVQDHCEVLLASSSLLLENLLSKKEADAGQAPADAAALNELGRLQAPSKDVKAATARSEAESREGRPQQSPSLIRHHEVWTRSAKGAAGAPNSSSQSQVPPKNSPPFPRLVELYFDVMCQG
jgi:hypothetical protein